MSKPTVVFVCSSNGGKSQLAASLMRHDFGDACTVISAGTHPGESLNGEAVASLEEIGASCEGEYPKKLDESLLDTATQIIVLGSNAQIDAEATAPIDRWITDEPSKRGIEGEERMRLVRDDIRQRVQVLGQQLGLTQ